ncbi:hypothetical protein F66182_1555 [Fusarium sp. NRRL 66182]|nr:hypothetical protein F66182_1555 [Fusarium sp. NRRL 66182]
MCTETCEFWDCKICGREIRKERDFKMCSKGRKENQWGVCGKVKTVQKQYLKDICAACEEEIRKKNQQ